MTVTDSLNAGSHRLHSIVFAIIIFISGWIVYINTWNNQFVWDDNKLILKNYFIKNSKYLGDIFTSDFFGYADDELKYGYYRPVISLSYMLNYMLSKDNPFGYHVINTLCHAVVCCLAYFFLIRCLYFTPFFAFCAGLIFAVHPVHTESVSWISGRTDVIATGLILGSFLMFCSAWKQQKEFRWKKYVISNALFALALLGKESSFVVPLLIMFYTAIYSKKDRWKTAFFMSSGYWLAFILYLIWRFLILRVDVCHGEHFSVYVKVLSFFSTLLLYVKKILWPLHLSAYIQNPPAESPADPRVLAGFAIAVMLFVVMIQFWKTKRNISFSVIFTFVTLLPVANIVTVSAPKDMGFPAAERFLYLPSLGFITIFLIVLFHVVTKKRLQTAIIGVIVFTSAALTWMRNGVWHDDETLYKSILNDVETAPLIWNNLGIYYIEEERLDEAETCFSKAISYAGETPRLLSNLASVEGKKGNNEAALMLLGKAIRKKDDLSIIWHNLGLIFQNLDMDDKAERAFRKALKLNPTRIESWTSLAKLNVSRKDYQKALGYYQKALELHPNSAALWNNIGVVYKLMSDLDKAVDCFLKAIRLNPHLSKAHADLGVVYAKQNRYRDAENELDLALALNPDDPDAANALGILYIHQNRTRDAYLWFTELTKRYPDHSEAFINLAILEFQMKHYNNSLKFLKKAAEINPGDSRIRTYMNSLKAILAHRQKGKS